MGRVKELTDIGKFLRKIRVEEGSTLKEMAKKMGMTATILSRIELGQAKIPIWFYHRLNEVYYFSDQEKEDLKGCIFYKNNSARIDLTPFNVEQKELIVLLSDRIQDLSDKDMIDIYKILKKRK